MQSTVDREKAQVRFGRSLKKLLEEKDLSYYDLERATGINYRSIGRYSKGEVDLPISAAEAIAGYFGKTVDEMVKGDDV
jgi:transcriptional regulator with XRE-family HTH domain